MTKLGIIRLGCLIISTMGVLKVKFKVSNIYIILQIILEMFYISVIVFLLLFFFCCFINFNFVTFMVNV